MMDLIKTSLGTLTAIGNGDARQALPGQHLANIVVSGTGAVSAAGSIQGTNDLSAPWKDIGAFSISGTDSAAGTVSWSLDYLYWRFVATGLTGSKVSAIVASESLDKQGGLATEIGQDGKARVNEWGLSALSNSGIGGKIYAALAAARANAPYRGPVSLAAGVTVTAGVAAPAVTEYRYFTGSNARYFKVFGLGASVFFEQYATTYLRAKGARTAESTYQNGVGGWAVQIRFTGQTATFSVAGSVINYVVLVNGKPVSKAGTNQATAGRIEVNCGAIDDWEVTLLMRQDHALMGVFTDGQLQAQPETAGAKVLYIGDSFCASTTSPASTIADQGYAAQLRLQHGFGVDAIAHGIGASGYNNGNALTNAWRTADAAAVNPDLIVLPFGTNDIGGANTEAAVKAGVTAGVSALKAACPKAKILVIGPWPKSLNLSAAVLNTELWISQACDGLGIPFYPINTAGANLPGAGTLANPWVWGDGDTNTAETVAGNSKWVTGDDGTHPSPVFGASYLASRTVEAVIETCKQLGW